MHPNKFYNVLMVAERAGSREFAGVWQISEGRGGASYVSAKCFFVEFHEQGEVKKRSPCLFVYALGNCGWLWLQGVPQLCTSHCL